jgi:hypothetical protein
MPRREVHYDVIEEGNPMISDLLLTLIRAAGGVYDFRNFAQFLNFTPHTPPSLWHAAVTKSSAHHV